VKIYDFILAVTVINVPW